MRHKYLLVGSMLILAALVLANSQTPRTISQTPQVPTRSTDDPKLAIRRTVATQQRVNRYFNNTVIPKLKDCWSRIQGRGTIDIEHNYTRNTSGKWAAGRLTVSKSTLPGGQEAVALQCLQNAVRDTSFPVERDDGVNKEYVLKWTWPVPFPTDMAEQTRAMFAATGGGSGSGCDGKGTPAACWDCVYQKDGIPKCKQKCSGYKECAYGPQNSCQASAGCVTGGLTGVASRTIIY